MGNFLIIKKQASIDECAKTLNRDDYLGENWKTSCSSNHPVQNGTIFCVSVLTFRKNIKHL